MTTEAQNVDTQTVKTAEAEAPKTFTQEQLDAIITQRIDREREKFQDYDELKTYRDTAEAEKLSTEERLTTQINELKPYKEQVEAQTQVLDQLAEAQISQLPEAFRQMIPTEFNAVQKLDYIAKNAEAIAKLTGKEPVTPVTQPETNVDGQEQTPGAENLLFGKYKTAKEFAKEDPRGFNAAFKNGKLVREQKRLGMIT